MSKNKTIREALQFIDDCIASKDPIRLSIARMMITDVVYSIEQDQGIDDELLYRIV